MLLATTATVLMCIFLYSFLVKLRFSGRITHRFNPSGMEIYFADKVLGGLIFGLIPLLLLVSLPGNDPGQFGLATGRLGEMRLTVVLASLLVLLIAFRLTGNERFRNSMLRADTENLTFKNGFLLAAGWIIYIFGYEMLFRGILWFTFYNALGFIPSLAINLFFYALAHYNMGRTAILGSIPVGIVFCLLSYFTGTFLFAFILHSIMSSGFEIFSLYRLTSGRIEVKDK